MRIKRTCGLNCGVNEYSLGMQNELAVKWCKMN